MDQINIDTFDFGDMVEAILIFLENKGVESVEFHFWSGRADEEVSTNMPVHKLVERMTSLYEEENPFGITVDGIIIDFDGSEFIIQYPEDKEEEVEVFKQVQ